MSPVLNTLSRVAEHKVSPITVESRCTYIVWTTNCADLIVFLSLSLYQHLDEVKAQYSYHGTLVHSFPIHEKLIVDDT